MMEEPHTQQGLEGPHSHRGAQAQGWGESPKWPRLLTCLGFSSGRGAAGGAGLG